MSRDHVGLFDTPPDRRQAWLGLAIVGVLFAAFLLILPTRAIRLREVDAFIPTVDAVMFLADLITATLLCAQAAVFRSRALVVLGAVYVYTALLLAAHALTFPGGFAANGLLGGGINTTSWLAILRRVAFPIAALVYVQLKQAESARPEAQRRPPRIGLGVLAATALAVSVVVLATNGHDWLPPFFRDRTDVIYANAVGYESVVFALSIAATAVLFWKRKSVLDMWLLVALSGWVIQSLLNFTLHARFTAGWYGLYGLMLVSHLVVMLALIAEFNRLYVRLALATSAGNREREARLISMDALAAVMAHEVGQPLTAVSLSARAGLKWLKHKPPAVDSAIKSLHDAIDAGRRATDVMKSLRSTFAKQPDARSELRLNDLVRATASRLSRELDLEKVSLQLLLDEAAPPILADRVQMEQVLVNLFTNAIESCAETEGRARRITIRSASLKTHDVLLEVSDNGAGIAPEATAHIFDAFFTTKTTGAGLGLPLCRAIVEAHGGRLWASESETGGATFHLELPSAGAPAHTDEVIV